MTIVHFNDEPFDPRGEGDATPACRPRDAASLILVRGRAEVLMGQRAKGHAFMPEKWVFPGGRVDPGDARLPAESEFDVETSAQLAKPNVRRPARAFGLAAARETLEEAGLRIGGAGGPPLARFGFLGRAITPPYRSRRFDARFFIADAETVLESDEPAAGEELLHTRWFSLEEAEALDLASITRFWLAEVRARLSGEARAPAYLRWARKAHVLERL